MVEFIVRRKLRSRAFIRQHLSDFFYSGHNCAPLIPLGTFGSSAVASLQPQSSILPSSITNTKNNIPGGDGFSIVKLCKSFAGLPTYTTQSSRPGLDHPEYIEIGS